MRIHCPSCSAPIPAADVNLDRMVAKCRACDAVFAFDGPDGALGANAGSSAEPAGRVLDRAPPAGIEVHVDAPFADLAPRESYREPVREGDPGVMTIRRRWFEASGLGVLFFACVWDAFLVFWYGIAFAMDGPILMFVFPLIHVAVGIGVTYGALSTLLNRTTIRCDAQAITVAHRPLPWFGARTTPAASIRRIYVEQATRGRKGPTRFRVLAETEAVGDLALLSGLPRLHAEHIAGALREHLRLPG